MGRKRKNLEEEEEEDDTSILPRDIVQSILQCLPTKSTLRFKAVSKLWNDITSDSYFIKIQSLSSPRRLLLSEDVPRDPAAPTTFRFATFVGDGLKKDAELRHPFGRARILSSCNGIILLGCDSHKFVLWNPSTRAHSVIWWTGNCPLVHGLYHDTITDDYKIVIFTTKKEYSVFSCKRKVWSKTRRHRYIFSSILKGWASIDGVCYWLCTSALNGPQAIMRFDGINERWDVIRLPEQGTYVLLANLRGRLGLVCFSWFNPRTIQIWMKEKEGDGSSWTKLRSIVNSHVGLCESGELGGFCLHRKPIPTCLVDDNLILVAINCNRFIIYDACEERVVGEDHEFPKSWSANNIVPCRDSLYFPIYDVRPRRKCRALGF